ncbi:MAG: hypothetical protein AAGH78_03410 [Cyanobacteria bacterium P01_H01_bin.58]
MQAPLSLIDKSVTLECPKCGKHAIVSAKAGIYQCLNCDFERRLDVHSSEEKEGGIGAVVVGAAGFLLTCALLL